MTPARAIRPDAESGSRDDPATTVSIARFERDRWIVVNGDDPSIAHHGVWLSDVLAAHRHAVDFRLHRILTIRYLIGDADTVERITAIRTAGARIAGLRREATHAERAIHDERAALVLDLAALRVAPGEIASILGLPITALPRTLSSDEDTRLARQLLAATDRDLDPR